MEAVSPWMEAGMPQLRCDSLFSPTCWTNATLAFLSAAILIPHATFPVFKNNWAVMHIVGGFFWPPTLLPAAFGFVRSSATLAKGIWTDRVPAANRAPQANPKKHPVKLYLLAIVGLTTSAVTIFYGLSHVIASKYESAEDYATQVFGTSLSNANLQCAKAMENTTRADLALISATIGSGAEILGSAISRYYMPAMWVNSVYQSFKKDENGKRLGPGWWDLPYHFASSVFIDMWPLAFTTSLGTAVHNNEYLTSVDANQLGKVLMYTPVTVMAVYNIAKTAMLFPLSFFQSIYSMPKAFVETAWTTTIVVLRAPFHPIEAFQGIRTAIPTLPAKISNYFFDKNGFWSRTFLHAAYFWQLGHWQNILLKGTQAAQSVAKNGWLCAPLKLLP